MIIEFADTFMLLNKQVDMVTSYLYKMYCVQPHQWISSENVVIQVLVSLNPHEAIDNI